MHPAVCRLALSKAQLYDAYVQHGYADPGTSEWATSVGGLVAAANQQAGGSPLQGANERVWLRVSTQPLVVLQACCMQHMPRVGFQGKKADAGRSLRPPVGLHPLAVQRFLEHRRAVLLRGGSDWADGVQRVDLYSWLLQVGAGHAMPSACKDLRPPCV